GVIFEVWQWEQTMFDGSVQTFERLKRPNGTNVITVIDDRILVQTQRQPDKIDAFSSLPGGRIEEGENPLEGAKRELLEETGYASDDWELLHEIDPIGKIEWTVYTYIARNCAFTRQPQLDAGEEITSRLLDFDEFLLLSDDLSFYGPELVRKMVRCRYNNEEKEEFRCLLWPSQEKVAK
ncbi:MAG: NUDIX hydrolase, partial [bacterium]|nr:NUDIX hydrolase [bacterium]